MAIVLNSPRPQFFDNNGDPLSLGRVSFYEANTTTLKDVYSDYTGTIPITNPNVLDANGYVEDGGIWLGDGPYKVKLEESDGGGGFNELWTVDFVNGATSGDGTSSMAVVNTVIDLRALDAGAYDTVYVLGYYAVGDGGGGWFRWNGTDGTADNSGTIISPNGAPAFGRWLRNFNTNTVYPMYFGIKVDDSSFKVESLFASMIDWCSANLFYSQIRIPRGDYDINGSVSFTVGTSVIIDAGAKFVSTDAVATSVDFLGNLVVTSRTALVDDNITLNINSVNDLDVYPEWWGAAGNGTTDDTSYILEAQNLTNANKIILFTKTYNILNTLTLTKEFEFKGGQLKPSTNNIDLGVNEYFVKDFVIDTAGAIDNSLWDALIEITSQKTLNWSGVEYSYTFGTTYTNVNAKKVSHFIPSGTNLIFNASVEFGTISNNTERIFDVSGSNVPTIYNTDIIPQWWGILSSAGFVKAFDSAMEHELPLPWINAKGDLLAFVSGGITLTATATEANENRTVRIKNVYLNSQDGTPLTCNTHLTIKDSTLIGTAKSVICTSVGTTEDSDVNIINCDLAGDISVTTTDEFSLINSRLSECIIIGEPSKVKVIGNYFTSSSGFNIPIAGGGVISGNHIEGGTVALKVGSRVNISSNTFIDSVVALEDPADMSITGNVFRGETTATNITLNGSSASFIVYGLRICDNSFSKDSGLVSYDTVLVLGNINATGHEADVYDNSVDALGDKTTRPNFQLSLDTSAGTWNVAGSFHTIENSITVSDGILPNTDQPIRCETWSSRTLNQSLATVVTEAPVNDSAGLGALECKYSSATRNSTYPSVMFKIYWKTRVVPIGGTGGVDFYTQAVRGQLIISEV